METIDPAPSAQRTPTYDSDFVAVVRNGKNQGLLKLMLFSDDTAELFHRSRTRSVARLRDVRVDPAPPWEAGSSVAVVGISTTTGAVEEWRIKVDAPPRGGRRSGCSGCGSNR